MSELPDWQIEIDQGAGRWQADVEGAETLEALRSLEVRALGKAGEIPALMKRIPQIPPLDRKAFGQAVNTLQARVAAAIELRRQVLVDGLIAAELDRAVVAELRPLLDRATQAFEEFDYAQALSMIEEFFWHVF